MVFYHKRFSFYPPTVWDAPYSVFEISMKTTVGPLKSDLLKFALARMSH